MAELAICGECDGDGWLYTDKGHYAEATRCAVCDGTGQIVVIDEDEEEETDE